MMNNFESRCNGLGEELAGLLLEPETASAEVRKHVAECEGCRRELEDLKATMGLMDAWTAPEPNPYFFTRFNARLREERQAAPQSWLTRLRASFVYGPRTHMKPLAAMVMTVVLLLGGGAYLGLTNWMQPPHSNDAAVVNDLQVMENNAQVLDTLEALSDANDDGN
jgi:hypothetical protein